MGIRVAYGIHNKITGLFVIETNSDSSFEVYDRIVSVNGKSISSADDYYNAIGIPKSGDEIAVTVKRGYPTKEIKVIIK